MATRMQLAPLEVFAPGQNVRVVNQAFAALGLEKAPEQSVYGADRERLRFARLPREPTESSLWPRKHGCVILSNGAGVTRKRRDILRCPGVVPRAELRWRRLVGAFVDALFTCHTPLRPWATGRMPHH